jgi:hypothetical protein
MNYLDKLPLELFLKILTDKTLHIKDILAIYSTNSRYYYIYNNNKHYIQKRVLINYNITSENNLIYNILGNKYRSFEKILGIYYKYLYNKKKISLIHYDISYSINEIPNLPNLEELNCCRFSLIKLQNFPNLKKLWCRYNNLKRIPNYKKLKELYCSYNLLENIDQYKDLEILECSNNIIEVLSEYPRLKQLNCDNNKLKILPMYPELKVLYCRNNKLQFIKGYKKLTDLYCSNNKGLRYIEKCPKLINIFCEVRLYTRYKYSQL